MGAGQTYEQRTEPSQTYEPSPTEPREAFNEAKREALDELNVLAVDDLKRFGPSTPSEL
jgi:hypothetical protein